MCGRIGRVDDILTITNYLAVACECSKADSDATYSPIDMNPSVHNSAGVQCLGTRLETSPPSDTPGPREACSVYCEFAEKYLFYMKLICET